MRYVKASIATVWLDCPNGCEDTLTTDQGSLMHLISDLDADVITCPECGEEFRIPRWVFLEHQRK